MQVIVISITKQRQVYLNKDKAVFMFSRLSALRLLMGRGRGRGRAVFQFSRLSQAHGYSLRNWLSYRDFLRYLFICSLVGRGERKKKKKRKGKVKGKGRRKNSYRITSFHL